jgi:tetratricopeptide (TPR) repeat protein
MNCSAELREYGSKLNPNYGLAYRNLGEAKRKKGDLDGAVSDFNRAVKLGMITD